jgi:DNA-binding response OmpR family regulator
MTIRILVIDDEPRWNEFVKGELSISNFEVAFATDTKIALSKLETDQPDLVIVSSRRLDAIKVIKEKYPEKLVIVVTVQPRPEEARNAYQLGASRYLAKSFGHQSLLNQIKELIPALSSIS